NGVTASVLALAGRDIAVATNAAKSSGWHQASTVDTIAGPAPRRAVTSRKLSSDERVVFTMKSSSTSGNRRRAQVTQSISRSLTMTTRESMRAAMKLRMTDSISGTPATGTSGFGIETPA